jgi:hypothetical protein
MMFAPVLLILFLPIEGLAQELAPPPRFETSVRPLLEKYCFECHGAKEKKKADVDFSHFKTEEDLARDPALWLNALTQLKSFAMPPEKASQPTDSERQFLSGWIDQAMDSLDARAPKNPGRTPLHRLNRVEYNNTIRDLIGLDLHPADDFPLDDTAHGFDNVAEALTLSPLLLDKYLEAAEKVLDRAIVGNGPLTLLQQRIEAELLPGAQATNSSAELGLEKEISVTVEVPQNDDYSVKVRAWQNGAGDDPATLVLKVDGVDTKLWSISGEGQPTLLEAVVPLGAGKRRLAFRHTWHISLPKEKSPPDARLFLDYVELTGPIKVMAHRRIFFAEPGAALRDRDAASQVVGGFATRAFRRPVEPGELDRLLHLYDQGRDTGKSHLEATRLALLSVLVSPQFLFRVERDTTHRDEGGAIRLSDWELASRLSYFLWSSMPDEELFQQAAGNRLGEPEILGQQIRRMLDDPKAHALVENFAGQWLGLRKFENVAPDAQMFPAFKPPLRQAMTLEAMLFVETIAKEDRSVLEFLDADWTIANEDLARHYGIRGVTGGHMRRVALTNSVRGGVLTMAAVLTGTSHPTRTSAVKRGKWVLEEILGAPPPPPPADVPELEVPAKGQAPATTLRERLERHRSDPRCFGCHVRMDALGLGLENFDAIGRWRDKEGANRIDASGVLPGAESFNGPAELKKLLAKHKEEFVHNLVEKMFVYALGRRLERYDRREIKRVTEALAKDGWRFSAMITEIASCYPFRYRQADQGTGSQSKLD